MFVQKSVVVNVAALNQGDCVKPSATLPAVSGYTPVAVAGMYTGKWDYSVTCGFDSAKVYCAVTNAGNKSLAASTVTVYVLYARTQL